MTTLHPQQRRNFTVVYERYNTYSGVFYSPIDNSINGVLHIILTSTSSFPLNLQIPLDDLPDNNIQTYMITGQSFVIDVLFNTSMQLLKNGMFQVRQGETLIINATNINGTIFVEGKIFT